ncbi:MAG TPA: O-antigen ligase family protein [Dehalococcoidia bacterium]
MALGSWSNALMAGILAGGRAGSGPGGAPEGGVPAAGGRNGRAGLLAWTRLLDQAWLPFLALGILPLAGFSPGGLQATVLAMEAIFLLMAVRNPLWVVGALFLSEMTARNYMLPLGGLQISNRLALTGIAVVVVLPFLSQPGVLSRRGRSVAFTAAAFAVVAAGATTMSGGPGSAAAFVRFMTSCGVTMLAVMVLVRGRRDLLRLGRVALTIGAASAALAVLQGLSVTGLAVVPHAGATVPFSGWGGRALGLSENPIYLTNDLGLVFLLLAGVLLARGLPRRSARWCLFLAALMALALYLSLTRSWVMGAAAAALAMGMILHGGIPRHLLVALLAGGLIFVYVSGHVGGRYLGDDAEGSAAARPVLWSTAIRLALDHPLFGIGFAQFMDVSQQLGGGPVATPAHATLETRVLGRFDPHNDLLNIWVSFGTPALALYLLLLARVARCFTFAARTLRDPALRGLAVGGAGALVAFVVNACFHNLFDSTLTLWFLAGLAVVLADAAEDEARTAPGEVTAA